MQNLIFIFDKANQWSLSGLSTTIYCVVRKNSGTLGPKKRKCLYFPSLLRFRSALVASLSGYVRGSSVIHDMVGVGGLKGSIMWGPVVVTSSVQQLSGEFEVGWSRCAWVMDLPIMQSSFSETNPYKMEEDGRNRVLWGGYGFKTTLIVQVSVKQQEMSRADAAGMNSVLAHCEVKMRPDKKSVPSLPQIKMIKKVP